MATTRVGMAIGGSLILALVLAVVSYSTRNWVRKWLHNQPAYQLNFADIELEPPCPKWIKSGQVGLLEKIRKGSKRPVSFSVLDLDVDALRNDFLLNSPWIDRVDRVVKLAGNKVRVQLNYREPVGYLALAKVYLDGHGVVLPNDDIDPSEIGFVVKLVDESTPKSVTPTPGDEKLRAIPLTPGHDHPDEKFRAAARLAGMLKQRLSSLEPRDNPARPVAILVTGHWLETDRKSVV